MKLDSCSILGFGQLPEGAHLFFSSISLRDEPLSSLARHLLDNVIIDDASLPAPEDHPLQDEVGFGHVNADVDHLVVHAMEAGPHLVDGD